MKVTPNTLRSWGMWLALNLVIGGYLFYALLAPASLVKTTLLPGKTTHGHHQIEMDCNACHLPARGEDGELQVGALMQDACNRCHAAQLEEADDTHPASKFNDPVNADLLLSLDAQNCLTCHREHVPEQTSEMGLTVPQDYCWHCHQDVADTRPSHADLAFDSCATAGCHNYHDNRALYEKFLDSHFGESDLLDTTQNPLRNFASVWSARSDSEPTPLGEADADAPGDPEVLKEWATTAHASAGINCRDCHAAGADWSDQVAMETCGTCHDRQVATFVAGRHGMRQARGLSPMTPADARLPMHAGSAHFELTCNQCHAGHRFDTKHAAVDACLQCHADAHSLAYDQSAHAGLWRAELAGDLPAGSGVSCATCHLPRLVDGDEVWVNHDQNSGLRPNEIMARQVCGNCHGLEFSLSVLASDEQRSSCYGEPVDSRIKSVDMAHEWFEQKRLARQKRNRGGK